MCEDAVISRLHVVCSTPDRPALSPAGDIVLCSNEQDALLSHAVPLSNQVYKWLPTHFMPGETL